MGKNEQRITAEDIVKLNVLAAVKVYSNEYGYLPSIRTLKDMTEIKSTSTVHKYLEELKNEGKLSRYLLNAYSDGKTIKGETTRRKILSAINRYYETSGTEPSIRELASLTGLKSASTVHQHLRILEKEGKLHQGLTTPRLIQMKPTKVKVLEAVNEFYKANGMLPSVKQILDITDGITDSTVRRYLKLLRAEGLIPTEEFKYGTSEGRETRQRILNAIVSLHERMGLSPTVREIAEQAGVKSTSTVERHLEVLKQEGKVFWEKGKVRTIRVLGVRKSGLES